MSEAAGPKGDTAFDLLAWRAALPATAACPQASDLDDWAERLAATGEDGGAALLRDVAAIQAGVRHGERTTGASGNAVMQAMAELRQLGVTVATAYRPAPHRASAPVAHVGETARDLHRLLAQPSADLGLVAILRYLAERPCVDHRTFAQASLPVLVTAIAATTLIDLAQQTRDLWDGPFGSAALFHRVAGLDGGGLGPFLVNIGRLARHGRDVLALAGVAHEAAVEAGASGPAATLAPWTALLSRGCGPALLLDTIDELGDAAAQDALHAILQRMLRQPEGRLDIEGVMRLRDTGLDNGDHALAVQAQSAIVRQRPDSELEIALLGAILASGGARRAAEATLRGWLAHSPGDDEVRQRLVALKTGAFAPFVVDRGFGSPPERQARRLGHRGILSDYPRRPGLRIDAVDVH